MISPPRPIGRGNLTQKFKFIEAFTRPFGHGTERVFRNMDRQTGLFAQKLIESTEEGAAAGQHQPAIDQVSRQLRRTTFQRDPN
jgi:hypothetical protein